MVSAPAPQRGINARTQLRRGTVTRELLSPELDALLDTIGLGGAPAVQVERSIGNGLPASEYDMHVGGFSPGTYGVFTPLANFSLVGLKDSHQVAGESYAAQVFTLDGTLVAQSAFAPVTGGKLSATFDSPVALNALEAYAIGWRSMKNSAVNAVSTLMPVSYTGFTVNPTLYMDDNLSVKDAGVPGYVPTWSLTTMAPPATTAEVAADLGSVKEALAAVQAGLSALPTGPGPAPSPATVTRFDCVSGHTPDGTLKTFNLGVYDMESLVSVAVMVNGVRVPRTQYGVNYVNHTVSFYTAPETGDEVSFDLIYVASAAQAT